MRGQNLTGINVTNVDLSKSIIDDSVLIDDRRPFAGGEEKLIEDFTAALKSSYPMIDWRTIWKQLRLTLSKPRRVTFFLNPEFDIMTLVHAFIDDVKLPIATITRGYHPRRAIFINSSVTSSIQQSILAFIADYFPHVMNARNFEIAPDNQLELPFSEISAPSQNKASSAKSLAKTISRIKKQERLTDIWIVAELPEDQIALRSYQADIASMVRMGVDIRYLLLCQDSKIVHSNWRRSLFDGNDFHLIEDNKLDSGFSSYLRSISSSLSDNMKFTAWFINFLDSNFSEWNKAKKLVEASGLTAIKTSRKLPVTVGAPEARVSMRSSR